MASIVCRAIRCRSTCRPKFSTLCRKLRVPPDTRLDRARSQITVCAVGNYFSFIENRDELLNDVMTIMRAKVGDVQDDLLVNLYARLGGDTKEALY